MNRANTHAAQDVHWRDSLRTRLMLWFGALVALVLLGGFCVAYLAAQRQLVAEAEARTRFEARQAAERVAAAMKSVRITGEGLIGLRNQLLLDRTGLARALAPSGGGRVPTLGASSRPDVRKERRHGRAADP